MKTIDEVLLERGQIIEQMKALSLSNPDGFDAETQSKYDAMSTDQERLKGIADRMHQESILDAEMNSVGSTVRPNVGKPQTVKDITDSQEYVDALDVYLRTGKTAQILNALEVGTTTEGGHLVHSDFDQRFREIRDDYNALRPFVDTLTTSGTYNIRVETGISTWAWIDEEGAYAVDSDPAFGNVQLGANKGGTIVKVSEELLQDSDFDLVSYLSRMFGRAAGIAEEAAFVNGDGTLKPTGMISGATSVARTESPLAAGITATTLMDAYYGLSRPWRANARWVLADDSIKDIRQIVDGDDNFVWQAGLQAGQPDRILGKEFIDSAGMPSAAESPVQSPVLFGDLSAYTVADRTALQVQRLDELFAVNGQVGFKGWHRVDGAVTQAAGIVKIAAF